MRYEKGSVALKYRYVDRLLKITREFFVTVAYLNGKTKRTPRGHSNTLATT
jgi:hypothetical protein